jgi:hypothetical protein
MMLQLAYFDRLRNPVVMDIGPVLDLCVPRFPSMALTSRVALPAVRP